jgi:hypothetical protein
MILPEDINLLQAAIFSPCSLVISQLKAEKESAEYCAYTFDLNLLKVKFRVAKITPTKIGQFVTLWQRSAKGPIAPFHIADAIDFFLVLTKTENRIGIFIFPKTVLHQQGIVSDDKKEGKRAMRVYPPWDKAENKQATKTQAWQLHYFLEMTAHNAIDHLKVKTLLSI